MFHSDDEHTGLSSVESLDHKSQNTSTKTDLSITDIGCIKKEGWGRKVTERKTTVKGTMKVTNSSERKEPRRGVESRGNRECRTSSVKIAKGREGGKR